MESHRCEITPGVGVPASGQPAAARVHESCQHVAKRGYRCRTPAVDGSGLCAHHARRHAQPQPDGRDHASITDRTASELLGEIDDFDSPAAVNLFLGNLVKQVVRKRVTRRDAIALAYLSQLILNSLSAMNREQILKQEARPRVNIIMDGIMSHNFGPEREREAQYRNAHRPQGQNKPQDSGRPNGEA